MKWFEFTPIDTLFFRGSKPMVMGEDHKASLIFPPPAITIEGAIRTAFLVQNGISFEDYNNEKANADVYEKIGRPGENPPFEIIGPLFKKGEDIFIPAPYHWFYDENKEKEEDQKDKKDKKDKDNQVEVEIIKGEFLNEKFLNEIKLPEREVLIARGKELKTAGGNWIKINDIGKPELTLYSTGFFFEKEERTGIALNRDRAVRTGHLYTFTHARLKKDISIVFGITKDIQLKEKGELFLGAEQRFGMYKKISLQLPQNQKDFFVSLSIVECNEKTEKLLVATGKLLYFGGWDLARGFHKPLKAYYPAGTVFKEKFSENLLPIN